MEGEPSANPSALAREALKIRNVLEFCALATDIDPEFRVRFALRDEATYEAARNALKPKWSGEFSPQYWEKVGKGLWFSLCPRPGDGLQHPLRAEISEVYRQWKECGRPLPRQGCGSGIIKPGQITNDFWEERARWGDDVEGFLAALWASQAGQTRKGANA